MRQQIEYKILNKIDIKDINKDGFFEIPQDIGRLSMNICNSYAELKKIRFSKEIIVIPQLAFANCGIEVVELPEKTKAIGQYSFYHCQDLKVFRMPKELDTITNAALADCTRLETLFLPKCEGFFCNVTAFNGTTNLKTLVLPKGFQAEEGIFNKLQLQNLKTVIIASTDIGEVERIKLLLPEHLKDKNIVTMDIDKMHDIQLARILNSTLKLSPLHPLSSDPKSLLEQIPKEILPVINSYFIDKFYSLTVCWEIQMLMLSEPLPRTQSEVDDYQLRLTKITDEVIEQMNAIPVNANQSFNLYDGNTNYTLFQLKDIARKKDTPDADETAQNKLN